MIRIRLIVTLVLVALWLPVTLHCELERYSGLEFLQCESEKTNNSDCDDTGCCLVEHSQYKIEQNQLAVPPPSLALLPAELLLNVAEVQPDNIHVVAVPPPELPQRWQFVFRAAPSPRAPSFVS